MVEEEEVVVAAVAATMHASDVVKLDTLLEIAPPVVAAEVVVE